MPDDTSRMTFDAVLFKTFHRTKRSHNIVFDYYCYCYQWKILIGLPLFWRVRLCSHPPYNLVNTKHDVRFDIGVNRSIKHHHCNHCERIRNVNGWRSESYAIISLERVMRSTRSTHIDSKTERSTLDCSRKHLHVSSKARRCVTWVRSIASATLISGWVDGWTM